MIQKLRERSGSESGFTLVELLVVMLILGLLAAIAIPSFFNQRDKARDADAKEAVRTAETAMETYSVDHNGSYTGADAADLVDIEQTLTEVSDPPAVDRLTATPNAAGDGYTVTVESEVAGQDFSITRNNDGTTDLTCNTDGEVGCPEGGDWG
jgi:type IV pilus assembly protein PilA